MFSDQHGSHVESSDIQRQVASEAQVKENVKMLYENFASVVTNVKVKLAVLVENELSKLTQITQYIEKHYQLSHLAEIKDVNELFDSISSHYCFLSCDLIKGVVEEFLSGDEVHSELTQYLKDLDTFKMSTQLHYIKTAIKEVLLQNQDVTETCTVSIKLNEIWGCTTLKKFENFFCLTFGKNFNYLNQLCTELGKECVCVSFVTPLSKLEFLIDKVLKQKEFIQRVGIIVNNDIIISFDETTITNLEQCFLEFAVTGNQFGISTLLELGIDVDHKSNEGRTALMIASYAGHQHCVQMLTSANANVDIQDNKGYTALMLATECNSIDIVSHLLSVNASVNLQTQEDDTTLIIACRNNLIDIENFLLNYNTEQPNSKTLLVSADYQQMSLEALEDKESSLHIAIVHRQIDVVKYLISECGCDPMCKDNNGWTCLHYAGACGSLNIMKYLITECKCNPMVTSKYGSTCLHIAILNKHIDVVKYLIIECGCDPMYKNNDGSICLHYAGQCGSLIIMKYLITECKCDPMVTNKYGSTCLHIAVLNKHIDVVKYLIIECGCDPMCKDNNEWTCLHYAGECGSLAIMKYLITECKCDPMVTDKYGSTCLHIAVFYKHIDVVKYLIIIECGCDPMCKDNNGWTCLHSAGECGSLAIMKYLITECKCDPMVTNKYGSTCLHIAVFHKHIDVVKYLIIECGCDPMYKDNNGWTCLHSAGECGSLNIMKYLITEYKYDPNVPLKNGLTCLHLAVRYKHHTLIEYLLSTGMTNPLAKNDDNQTPFDFTRGDKALRNVFTKFSEVKISHPVDSFVNVLLLGNSGAGKSTLAKVITERTTNMITFLGQYKNVEGVEPYTAGIIPTKLKHRELGNIILYDFAGHPEYYTSHTAVIENLLQGSAAAFVIVVNIMEEEATKHLQQWLTIVNNEASKALNQCHIIVAVSHVDEMIDRVTRERKQSELQQIIKERCDTSVSIEYLDCRKLGGSSVSSLFSKLSSACQSIRNYKWKELESLLSHDVCSIGRK